MDFSLLIKKKINFTYLNKKIKGNIHFFNYKNHNFIIFLKNYDYQIIKIPKILSEFLNIILKYKNNKNSNFYKVLKYNYKRINIYKYYLIKIYEKYNLISDLKNIISDYLIDKDFINAFKTINDHKNKNYINDNLLRVTIYKDKQKINLFKNKWYKKDIIVLIPDMFLLNFINIIKDDNDYLKKFYTEINNLNKNNFNGYFIYY